MFIIELINENSRFKMIFYNTFSDYKSKNKMNDLMNYIGNKITVFFCNFKKKLIKKIYFVVMLSVGIMFFLR